MSFSKSCHVCLKSHNWCTEIFHCLAPCIRVKAVQRSGKGCGSKLSFGILSADKCRNHCSLSIKQMMHRFYSWVDRTCVHAVPLNFVRNPLGCASWVQTIQRYLVYTISYRPTQTCASFAYWIVIFLRLRHFGCYNSVFDRLSMRA